ncbi:four helix bundle protein [Sinomicrobium soli]|uniref:four helix bundle protein n=1 Tax=Sinomicrobium sp. N-1-3-6 TaxID=2219864 RepID=UPI000DCEC736|nr:four helix bundle protein [Sinomicrobium sp. N-1-3-6]RAV28731.1 four helix bundle protein [Sinomicrobium sp. N-1-3-6]
MHKVDDLIVWKKSIQLAKEIYVLCSKIPDNEKFGIIFQIKRSSVSIPSNIAEGAGRNSNKEFKHFLGIANGSCYELQTQLILIKELNLTDSISEIDILIEQCVEIQKMIYSFKSKI